MSLYRQALRLHAHSTVHLFESNAQQTDPLEAQYLLGVSKLFLGEREAGLSLLTQDNGSFGPFATSAQSWLKALEQSQDKPEQLEAFPISWSEVSAGGQLASESVPIINFLNGDSTSTMSVTDNTLWLRSLWHEKAACLF